MDIALKVATIIVILLGILGAFLPFLPGIPVIFVAIAAYGWYEGFQVITAPYLVVLAGIALLSMLVDYLSTFLGARYFDSSRYGMWGAVLGGLVGIFIFPPFGIIIGPWAGALLGERLQGHDWARAWRSGLGAVIGLFSGIAFKVALGVVMLVSFLVVIF
jgi:uncharacterized protein